LDFNEENFKFDQMKRLQGALRTQRVQFIYKYAHKKGQRPHREEHKEHKEHSKHIKN
jgi:hypothetical protein